MEKDGKGEDVSVVTLKFCLRRPTCTMIRYDSMIFGVCHGGKGLVLGGNGGSDRLAHA